MVPPARSCDLDSQALFALLEIERVDASEGLNLYVTRSLARENR
jgi:hypothetical protein